MSDLQRIHDRLAVLRSEIEARQQEAAELETAARVLQRLHRTDGQSEGELEPVGRLRKRKIAKPTILQMAKSILLTGGEMYYVAVADNAIAQGYQGRKGSNPERIRRSFWAIMKRHPETFDAIGGGRFRLKGK